MNLAKIAEMGLKGIVFVANVLTVAAAAYCISYLYGAFWALAYVIASAFLISCPTLLVVDEAVTIYFWYRTGNWVPFALNLLVPVVAFVVVLVLGRVVDNATNSSGQE